MHRLENRHWWFTAKRHFVTLLLDRHLSSRGGLILDIGCGTGGLTEILKPYGHVVGLERHPTACALFRRDHDLALVQGDANRLPFKKNSFQLITLLDVLYHQFIRHDVAVLSQVHELLVSGGLLLITDSAFEFLRSAHDRAVMARHRYTLKELRTKMTACGFTVLRGSYLYGSIFPLVVLSRLWGKCRDRLLSAKTRSDLKETPLLINRLLTFLLIQEGKIFRLRDLPLGSSLILLGRKE